MRLQMSKAITPADLEPGGWIAGLREIWREEHAGYYGLPAGARGIGWGDQLGLFSGTDPDSGLPGFRWLRSSGTEIAVLIRTAAAGEGSICIEPREVVLRVRGTRDSILGCPGVQDLVLMLGESTPFAGDFLAFQGPEGIRTIWRVEEYSTQRPDWAPFASAQTDATAHGALLP